MIIPYGFLKQPISGAPGLYDGVAVFYSLRRPDMATLWTNAVVKVRRDSDNNTCWVFFDGNDADDTISLSSLTSTSSNTTPGATTLGTWLGSNGLLEQEWLGITDDNSINANLTLLQTTTSLQLTLSTTGALLTKNGTVTHQSAADRYISMTNAIPALDDGNDFTVYTVSYSNTSTASQCIFSTRPTSGGNNDRQEMFNDRRANQLHSRVRDNSPATNTLLLSARQDSNNQRLLTMVLDDSAQSWEGFYNGTSQGTDTWTNTRGNVGFIVFAQISAGAIINGGVQEIIIFPNNSTDQATIESDIDTYYSIP